MDDFVLFMMVTQNPSSFKMNSNIGLVSWVTINVDGHNFMAVLMSISIDCHLWHGLGVAIHSKRDRIIFTQTSQKPVQCVCTCIRVMAWSASEPHFSLPSFFVNLCITFTTSNSRFWSLIQFSLIYPKIFNKQHLRHTFLL